MSEIKLSFDIKHNDFDRAGSASSSLKNSLKQLGYPPEDIRRLAIASYEAEMNVVVHASDGKMEAVITPEMVDVWVIDGGPGIKNVELAMQEGYSTAPDKIRELGFGAGMGLPNIKKNSDFFEIESKVPDGTKVHFIIRRKSGK
ncbi:MAG: ATP-binding protein [bacterium]|uniref:Anti-sigma B factor RsbT n=2 Tax=Bacteria candidate phyla TaxID=1783234 RepID=A0A101I011_UNCT6|nr:MAG: Anti-sigma B factor RsbT [candidate division TA06 bacterium 32_111]KUK86537.1 MAG: Anti-sigma B factor RsbT [candidate division TA06 bacterium 34_109]MDI6700729.1 ATP-binding protein [bacterium]HAF07886.1 anti-sigma regulatory factor [candidate division WOR-3 bacterium]HCP16412.1 anti-sigma regulatory factor [candidate division WOR-3 bacterium]